MDCPILDDSSSYQDLDSESGGEAGYETDLTDPADIDDLADSFAVADNAHPPEYYIRQLKELEESEFEKEDYKTSTTSLLDRIEEHWFQHCRYISRDPHEMYQAVSTRILYNFFDWLLNQKRGKSGRRIQGIKYKSSLGTYWKVYRLVYERATGDKIEGPLTRSMHKVLRKLAKKHKLNDHGREKPCMYSEDLKGVLRTNIYTTKKRYRHGRLRIEIQLFLQLAGFTANRPQALLELRYRHIIATLLRDQGGGPNRVLLEFTFEFTKDFLGAKDINTFPIPEIVYDPSLIFSPHVVLGGIMFADQVFAAPNLMTPEKLSSLDIEPGRNQLPIPLKPRMADVPVFRAIKRTLDGWKVSKSDPLTYAVVRSSMIKLGQITGFKQVTRPYALRYGAGKAFNENGNVSEALQNLMMQHADIRTFLRHYLHRRVTADTAAIVRGLDPQESVMRSACNMSRWIDPDRPWGLTTEQAESVNGDPIIRSLLQRRDRLKQHLKGRTSDHPIYQKLNKRITSERERLRAALLVEIQKRYEIEGPVRAIEQQLAGVKVGKEPKILSYFSEDTLPEQRRLIETMILAPPAETIEAERQRRDDAINAVTAYCKIEEGSMFAGRKRSGGRRKDTVVRREGRPLSEAEALKAAMLSVYIKHPAERPTICFLCLGNEQSPFGDRTYSFSRPGDLSKHFKKKHLLLLKENKDPECKLCKMTLENETHFRNHAATIHGTIS